MDYKNRTRYCGFEGRRPLSHTTHRLTNSQFYTPNFDQKTRDQERNRGYFNSHYVPGNQYRTRGSRGVASKASPELFSPFQGRGPVPTPEEKESTAEFTKQLEEQQKNDGGCYTDDEEEKTPRDASKAEEESPAVTPVEEQKSNKWEEFFGKNGEWIALQTAANINMGLPAYGHDEQPHFETIAFQQKSNRPRANNKSAMNHRNLFAKTSDFEEALPENGFSERNRPSHGRVHIAEPVRQGARLSTNYGGGYRNISYSRYSNTDGITKALDDFSDFPKDSRTQTNFTNVNNRENSSAMDNISSLSAALPNVHVEARRETSIVVGSGMFANVGKPPKNPRRRPPPKRHQRQLKALEKNIGQREDSYDVRIDQSRHFEQRGAVGYTPEAMKHTNINSNSKNGTGSRRQNADEQQQSVAMPNRRPQSGRRPENRGFRPNAHRPSSTRGHEGNYGGYHPGNGDAFSVSCFSTVLQNDHLRNLVHNRTPVLYHELVGFICNAFGEKLNLNK